MANLLPPYTTPADLADHFGVSERTLRGTIRDLGAYAKLGQKTILFQEHVEQLKEAMKCPSNSSSAMASGTSEELLPEGDFTSLQKRLIGKSRNVSKRKPKPKRGNVVSMGQGQG
ncbi:hypothetical protein [Roseovarius pacificus]|uniref:hypothetical protein n=1 Tax=Roseovarius pacificus TaxID=337701 RepID=UPI00190EFF92|nr:hypothetical protein [Roseovarius pacificus]GGO55173.1 hypothetical protein GCM10011315_17080 [Roseovarius pacificus]